ncbi:MAG: ATP-binding protein, partial [Candidatus Binatia bacterium]
MDRELPSIFVGRERELHELRAGLDEVASGQRRLFVLAGESGIGKTRLADEFAALARQQGARVLWGRCWEGEGAPAFWPWVQIVRACLQQSDADTLTTEMGNGAAAIAQIVPDIAERLPGLSVLPELEPIQARFRLFDSLTTFLKNLAQRQLLVLILDDLQWADEPSLLLLHFLAREIHDARLLVIGAYREGEVERTHSVAEALGSFARESRRLHLRGLTEMEVARFLAAQTGAEPQAALVTALCEQTEGNPFFMSEMVRLLRSEGDHSTLPTLQSALLLPHGVRETLRRRLGRLSAACHQVLTVAAVIGREFGLRALAMVGAGLRPDPTDGALLALLDEASAAQIVSAVPGSVGRYR